MPQLVVWIASYVVTSLVAAGVYSTVALTIAYYGTMLVVSGALLYGLKSAIKPSMSGVSLSQASVNKLSMSRDPIPAQRITYGTQRLSGPIIFIQTKSKPGSSKNEYLDIIVALAGHEVTAINEIFVGDNYAVTAGGTVQAPFTNVLTINKMLGSPTSTVDAATQALIGNTVWTNTCALKGVAAIHARLEANQDVYSSGIPNISCVVQGKKIYDPRDSTTAFSENPALIVRDYMLNELGFSTSEVDDTAIINAANICDELVASAGGGTEKRYTCNYSFLTSEKPASILEKILISCYAKLTYTSGKFTLKAGAYVTPSITIQEDDLRGGITVATKNSIADAYNGVKGLYTDGASITSSFLPADFVAVTSSYYQYTEDNGLQNFVDVELPSTIYHGAARRLAKINLLDSRQNLTCQMQLKIGGLRLVAGDFVYVNNTRMGWTQKPFEVIQLDVSSDLGIDVSLKEASSAVYDWTDVDADVTRDLSPNTNLPNPYIIPPPTGLTTTELVTSGSDGTIFSKVNVTWDALGTGSLAAIELEYKKNTDLGYISLGSYGESATSMVTNTLQQGVNYNFHARNVSYTGIRSAWTGSSILITGDVAPPVAPTGLTANSGSGCNLLKWNANTEIDIDTYNLYRNTSNSFAGSTFIWSGYATAYSDFYAPVGTLAYYWLKAEDTTGNTSSFAGPVSASAASGTGSNGTDGSNTATIYIYQRAASAPSLPSATCTYTFSTANLTGLNNGWTQAVPATNGNPLYMSAATANGTGLTETILAAEWAASIILVSDGAGGATGSNTATVFLYQRAASTPTVPASTTTYTFSTAVLTGTLGSWTQTVPAGTNPIYITTAAALSTTDTDSILTAEWSTVRILAENGTDGDNNATVHLYQRAASAPSVPAASTTYTFATGVLTGTLGSWTQAVPATDGNPCYITTAVAVSNTATDTIATGDWSSPVVFVQDGSPGTPGATFILTLADTVGNPLYKALGNGNDCSAGYAFAAGTIVYITAPGSVKTHPSAGTDFITWSGTWASKLDVENILDWNTNVVMTKDTSLTADYP